MIVIVHCKVGTACLLPNVDENYIMTIDLINDYGNRKLYQEQRLMA
jgi:hypothetical protein